MAKIQAPIKKGEAVHVSVADLTHEGKGVAKIDGYPLFIEGMLPGETGEVEVTKLNKGYGFAKLLRLEQKSPERVSPSCSVYEECGGCQLQHLSYAGQMEMKYNQVRNVMDRIAKLPDVPVHSVLGMEEPWRYRNKAQVPVGLSGGRLVAGFYKKRSHEIIDMTECLIQHEESDVMIQKVKDVCAANGVMSYDEQSHKGVLRHVMARIGYQTGEKMAVLITRTNELPNEQAIIAGIRREVPGITSIVQNVNPDKTNVIFGSKTRTLFGEDVIYDTIGSVKFAISARSFYQVNPVQTEVLYNKALEYAGLTGEETVIDAYCGIGTISLFLAQKAKQVYGVEIVPQAIEDARKNAELNGITNAYFEAGKAEEVIPAWYKQGIRPDVIVVDPPRKGCDEALLETILKMKPKRVVYVSCNPGTLARDLRVLEDGGYRTREVQPVDMFPQTVHVEAVAVLELR
ncbi:23S rRNA (uracil(1939)-C(5))-methyltransferase RlmD [Domibacillus indicus]|uniref:23S rRNA (uracil(1939)-C(5))-methyltransferase RlmD n=1 Tax=Domibacillus indicus TaxID=1437523 RepID=UPI00061804B8|nr:23S rRNA (uracil(1939)-C(5))-methyltransferase RlmD [Domibacillus indicus]